MNNRICVLQVFAGNGLGNYIYYLAIELKKMVRDLVIVSNGFLTESERNRLEGITRHLYERGDAGFDSGAFKDALENYITWERIKEYDELILVNDTCYGPIYPFAEVFDEMDTYRNNLDFWAMTEQETFRVSPFSDKMIPYHIQPYFAVIRKRLLHSEDFRAFWKTLVVPRDYDEAVHNYELKFAAYFTDLGYSCGAYVDNSEFCRSVDEGMAYVFFDSYRLVSEHRCPLIKRKAFTHPSSLVLMANAGETIKKTLDFIAQNTQYDVKLILDDLICHMEPIELYRALHLDYIVSGIETGKKDIPVNACIVIFLRDKEFALRSREYISRLSKYMTFYVGADSQDVKDIFEGIQGEIYLVDCLEEVLAREIEKFDYYCVIYDNMSDFEPMRSSVKWSYMELVLENMIADKGYIEDIIGILEREERLGLLAPPEPYFSNLLLKSERIRKENNDLLFTVHNAFWLKKEVMRSFLNDFVQQKRLGEYLPQMAKRSGYYCGKIISREYASLYLTNQQYLLESVNQYTNMTFINSKLLDFCHQYKKVYIYGAGEYGHYCLNFLKKNNISFMGFVVSNGHKKITCTTENIIEIGELNVKRDEGVIIAIGAGFVEDVELSLKKYGFKNIIRFTV